MPRHRRSREDLWNISEMFVGYLVRMKLLKEKYQRDELKQIFDSYKDWRHEMGMTNTSFGTVLMNLRLSVPPYLKRNKSTVTFLKISTIEYIHLHVVKNDALSKLDVGTKRRILSTNLPNNPQMSDDAWADMVSISLFDMTGNIKETKVQHAEKYTGIFKVNEEQQIQIKVKNLSENEVRLHDIKVLRNAIDFSVLIKDANLDKALPCFLAQYEVATVSIRSKLQSVVGINTTEICFQFDFDDGKEKGAILRLCEFRCNDDIILETSDDAEKVPYEEKRKVNPIKLLEGMEVDRGIPLGYVKKDNKRNKLMKKKKYIVPKDVREQFEQKALNPDSKLLLKNPLSQSNYAKKFHLLLYAEEIQCERDLGRFTLDNVAIQNCSSLMKFQVDGLAEKRPSVLRGDRVYAKRNDGNPIVYEGFVHTVQDVFLLVEFGSKMTSSHIKGMKYSIHFTLNRNPMNIMHRAVDLVYADSLLFPSLFPHESNASDDLPTKKLLLFNRAIEDNPQQYQAISNIVHNTMCGCPYVIFGPPGTGKTVTMVEAVMQVIKHNPAAHILLCAPSNSACDVLTYRLLNFNGQITKRDIFRMNGITRQTEGAVKMHDSVKSVSNYRENEIYFPSRATLETFKVIICTPMTAGRLATAKFPRGHFTDVFFDESGYCMEPEFAVTLGGIANEASRIVLAGDFQQLGPVVHSHIAKANDLGRSLLQRLVTTCPLYAKHDGKYNPKFITKLLQHHRSHEMIIAPSNHLFYDNELICKSDPLVANMFCSWSKLMKKNFPLLFHGIQGEDKREESSPSFFNALEVAKVIGYVRDLLDERKKLRIYERDIGIISPYHRQVSKIRKELSKMEKIYPEYSHIKVGSVEEFQGQERPVIIVSTVRSNTTHFEYDMLHHLGFLKNPQRFNVAITRAKSLLIVIGNPRILCLDPSWKYLINYCVDNNAYVGLPNPLFNEESSLEAASGATIENHDQLIR